MYLGLDEETPEVSSLSLPPWHLGDSRTTPTASSLSLRRCQRGGPHTRRPVATRRTRPSTRTRTRPTAARRRRSRDTADSSPEQAFTKHLVGSVPGYPSQNAPAGHLYYTDNSPVPTTRKAYETPEDMMAQMIRMNIMAEQARQLVAENNKFTQPAFSPRP
ncbi:hypothetical protein PINS_up021837 [Pythium insidiosum]|nr:hypothetical protein PINS_up021837 [Pythium insidiosum]